MSSRITPKAATEVTSPVVRIREYQPSDLRRILQLERAAFPEDAWQRSLFEWYAGNSLFLVALVDASLAGYCVVRQSRPDTADLDSIAVFRRHRRHGVGTALLTAAIARLRRRRVANLGLMVRRDNAGAIAFYKRYGFTRTRTVPQYYEDGGTAWRMVGTVIISAARR